MGPLKGIGIISLSLALGGCCRQDADSLLELPADATNLWQESETDSVVAVDLFETVAACDTYHRGTLLDLGSKAMLGRYGHNVFAPADVRDVLKEGATWARVETRKLSIQFYQADEQPVFVETRIRGLGSRRATVRIDGRVLGVLRFKRDEVGVFSTSTTKKPLAVGNHVVSFRFHRSKRDVPKAEIDWVRIGIPDNDPTTYGAPTIRDLAVDATIAGRPHRTLALRGPGMVRCAFTAREDMRLQTILGYTGPGEGEARVQLVEPGKPAYLLQSAKVGGEKQWAETVDLPLEGRAGQIMAIELIATKTSSGGRVLFGDPTLRIRKPEVSSRPKAKVVVVIVFSGASTNQIPPYADHPLMPSLTALAQESVVFYKHRAPTTVSAGSVASLLTGLSPTSHKVADTGARLPSRFPTLGTIARDGRAATSMFTGNPTTFEAFGFFRGWDRYAEFTPVSGTAARAPLREATKWVDERLEEDDERPLLVIVHARGGHPPWALRAEQAKDLPPKNYAGNLNSRRGGQILAKKRFRRYGRRKISAQDRVRVQAFVTLALADEDALIGKLVDVLREREVWDSTMLVVTSDIAMGGGTRIPFGDGQTLSEDVLQIPLMIRFPQHRFGGSRVRSPTSTMDVAPTVLAAMALDPSEIMQGRDLLEVAAYPDRFGKAPQFASWEGSYSTRWGDWLLWGKSPRQPQLCVLDGSSMCSDNSDEDEPYPFFASWMWRMTYRHVRQSEAALRPTPSREPATLDPDTVAALTVWGNLEPKSKSK